MLAPEDLEPARRKTDMPVNKEITIEDLREEFVPDIKRNGAMNR